MYSVDDLFRMRRDDFRRLHQYAEAHLHDIVFEINQNRTSKFNKRCCGPLRVISIVKGHKVDVLDLQSLDDL